MKNVSHTWRFVKVFDVTTGDDLTADYSNSTIEFQKDGTFIWTDAGTAATGTWKFASDKENIIISDPSGSSNVWVIKKLAGKDLWFRDDVGTTDSYEYQLEPK